MNQALIESILFKAIKNHEKQNFSEAEQLYEEALKIHPNHIGCLNYFGTMLAQTNRKKRAEKLFLKASQLQPNNPFVKNNLGNICFENGDYDKAISYYEAAILLKPDFVDSNLNLGIILNNMGHLNKAIEHLNKVIKIQPNNTKCYSIIAAIYKEKRNFQKTLDIYKKIFEIDPENLMATTGVVDLFNTIRLKNLKENNSYDLVEIFTFLYKKNSINHNMLFDNAKNLIIFAEYHKRLKNLFTTEIKLLNDDLVISILKKELFHLMLQKSLFRDMFLEKLLYKVRKEFLILLNNNETDLLEENINFILSLAIQSSLNEYVIFQSDEEINLVNELKKKIENNNIKESEIAILACYFPLIKSKVITEKLLNFPTTNKLFEELINIQIKDILEEEKLKKTINSIEITDKVSKKVRNQYEENPYPRWRNVNKISKINFITDFKNDISPTKVPIGSEKTINNILIAGCGTGQQLARQTFYADSNILAVDLSLASLALAKRKMNELDSKNIEFLHADLLNLKNIKRKFNVIECVGVLHHLNDPEAGLKVLLDLLEPNGYLKLGLYSEYARQHIVKSKKLLKKYNYKNTIHDIRNCREMIKNNTDNKSFLKLNYNYDFYSTSSFRDLILHVQEHLFTLPKISKVLENYNLEFLGFTNPHIKKDYSKLFNDDVTKTSLQNWNNFELKYPDTFKSMYQFWVKKVQN